MPRSTCTLELTPADVSMFRSSRPFEFGGEAASSFPVPQTVAGAVYHWLGVTLSGLEDAFLEGPYLAYRNGVYLPTPRHLLLDEAGNLVEARPYQGAYTLPRVTTSQPGPGGIPLLWAPPGPDYSAPGGWMEHGIVVGLLDGVYRNRGIALTKENEAFQPDGKFFLPEPRTRTALDPGTGRAAEGLLFTTVFLRLQHGVCLRMGLSAAIESDDLKERMETAIRRQPWLFLGGERRVALITVTDGGPLGPPPPLPEPIPEKILTYCATPGLYYGPFPEQLVKHGWWLEGMAAGDPLPVSGWHGRKRKPRKTRYLARAGSVYFWRKQDDNRTIPPYACADPKDNRLGWGRILTGVY